MDEVAVSLQALKDDINLLRHETQTLMQEIGEIRDMIREMINAL